MPGNYGAVHPAAVYTGGWKFSDLGADIPENFTAASVTIRFRGTDFALAVRRADYRGYLYVTIDGQPANRLPQELARARTWFSPRPNRMWRRWLACRLRPGWTRMRFTRP